MNLLTRLTRHDTLFQWCTQYEIAFQSLNNALCTKPILKFLDAQKPYVLFTDASKYVLAGVLTQPYTKEAEGKAVTPSNLCKWTLQGVTTKLGGVNQGGLCYIYIYPLKNLASTLQMQKLH